MEAVLTGTVCLAGQSLVWDGVWGMPTPTQSQKFHYEAAPSQFKHTSPSALLLPPGRTVVFTGQFEMLNPQAVSKRSTCREKRLELCNSKRNKIKGSGSNRFGSFQLTGEFDPKTNLLQVKRKYTGKPSSAQHQPRNSSAQIKRPFSDHFPQAQSLLFELQQGDKYGWFASPVDCSKPGMEQYSQVIQRPIDFSTIETKFKRKQYDTLWECVEDMRLVMRNAMQFNPKSSAVFRAAQSLQFLLESRTKYWTFDGSTHKQRRVRAKDSEEEDDQQQQQQSGFDSFDELGDVDAEDFHSANVSTTPSPIPAQLENDLEISSLSCSSSPITLEDLTTE